MFDWNKNDVIMKATHIKTIASYFCPLTIADIMLYDSPDDKPCHDGHGKVYTESKETDRETKCNGASNDDGFTTFVISNQSPEVAEGNKRKNDTIILTIECHAAVITMATVQTGYNYALGI